MERNFAKAKWKVSQMALNHSDIGLCKVEATSMKNTNTRKKTANIATNSAKNILSTVNNALQQVFCLNIQIPCWIVGLEMLKCNIKALKQNIYFYFLAKLLKALKQTWQSHINHSCIVYCISASLQCSHSHPPHEKAAVIPQRACLCSPVHAPHHGALILPERARDARTLLPRGRAGPQRESRSWLPSSVLQQSWGTHRRPATTASQPQRAWERPRWEWENRIWQLPFREWRSFQAIQEVRGIWPCHIYLKEILPCSTFA